KLVEIDDAIDLNQVQAVKLAQQMDDLILRWCILAKQFDNLRPDKFQGIATVHAHQHSIDPGREAMRPVGYPIFGDVPDVSAYDLPFNGRVRLKPRSQSFNPVPDLAVHRTM